MKSLRSLRGLASSMLLVLAQPLLADTNSAWFARPWQTEDGLPEHTIVGLEQTRDGYLWVATQRSLSRFDGVHFQEFLPAKPQTPTTDQIRVTLLDQRGRLWLARDGGVVACVEGGKIAQVFNLERKPPGAQARTMAEDLQGGIWLSDNLGAVFQIKEGVVHSFGSGDGLSGQSPCWLATDNGGRIWFSQAGRVGVFKDGRFATLRSFGQLSARITRAREGGIWVSAGSRLFRVQRDGQLGAQVELQFDPGVTDLNVSALYEDKAGGLWIGTSTAGLFRYDAEGLQRVGISHPSVINISEDSEGNIWVGTRGGGLNRLSPRAVLVEGLASGLPFAVVQSACEDATGTLWVAGQNGGLARRHNGVWSSVTAASGWGGGEVACVAAVAGEVIIGTRENGLFGQTNGAFTVLPVSQRLENRAIRSLYSCTNGDLWIAVNRGVARLRARDGDLKHFALPPAVSAVRAMVQDAREDIWLSTTSDGQLFRIHEDLLINETTNVMREPKHIRCLQITEDGSLWFGFVGQGLGLLKNGRFSQFGTAEGLWDDYISQILPDDRGRLWLAGNRGIFHVARSELETVAEKRAPRVRSVTLGREQGVPNLQATFGVCPNAVLTPDGRLLMPMLSGLAIVEPRILRKRAVPPPVFIERVTVNGQLVAADDLYSHPVTNNATAPVNLRTTSAAMHLGPGINRMEFQFTALSLASPENVTFRFKLEGMDQDWLDVGATRSARYPHIPPGAYQFRVIACDHNGIWNEVGDSFKFTVKAHLLEAAWFRIMAAAAVIGLIGGGSLRAMRWRYQRKLERLEQQQALERERARIAQDLHDDLGAGLVEINFGSELAQDPALSSDEVREHTREIGSRAKEMVTALDEIVWAVNPKHDSLSSLATYFCQFAQHFLRTTPVRCHLEVTSDLPAAPLNAEQRHSLFLAFKEALSNVVQHSDATELHLAIATTEGILVVSLRDNGRGFDLNARREHSHADGLGNMQRRLEQLGGRCNLASRPGAGTTVSFHVPLTPTHPSSVK